MALGLDAAEVLQVKKIPISAAKKVADLYDYDQVVIIARKVGEGEHVTTYGTSIGHCASAALQGRAIKKLMGWPEEDI